MPHNDAVLIIPRNLRHSTHATRVLRRLHLAHNRHRPHTISSQRRRTELHSPNSRQRNHILVPALRHHSQHAASSDGQCLTVEVRLSVDSISSHAGHATRACARARGHARLALGVRRGVSRWSAERGAHGNVTHRHNTMAQRQTRMPETRPRSRNHHLPTMRRHPRLQRVTTTQQRRGRPHRAPRTRRRRHPREHAHSLPTLQPITRRQASITETHPHLPRMVTRDAPILTSRAQWRGASPGRFWAAEAGPRRRKRHATPGAGTDIPPTHRQHPGPLPPPPTPTSLPPHCGISVASDMTHGGCQVPIPLSSSLRPGLS